MNKRQRITLWVGIGVIVLMGLFPPASLSTSKRSSIVVDTPRLLIQWGVVIVVTGGLFVTFKDKSNDQDRST